MCGGGPRLVLFLFCPVVAAVIDFDALLAVIVAAVVAVAGDFGALLAVVVAASNPP